MTRRDAMKTAMGLLAGLLVPVAVGADVVVLAPIVDESCCCGDSAFPAEYTLTITDGDGNVWLEETHSMEITCNTSLADAIT